MARRQFTIVDRYAFYQAYEGLCSYCRRPLEFNDFEIDHVIAWHFATDPQEWAETLEKHGLPANFDVEGDENLRPACRSCNGSKSGTLPPRDHVLLLLDLPKKKAASVADLRAEILSEQRLSKALAVISMAAGANPSVRDQVLGVLAIESPRPAVVPPSTWPDDMASQRVRKLLGAASSNLLTWPQDTNGRWIERPELDQLRVALSESDGRAIALLGPPGSGKSALLARLGTELTNKGCLLLAVKADMLPRHIASIVDLDQEWGLSESLVIVLERLAADSPVFVLIDQLDALASLMDAHSERLSAMLSLTSRLLLIPRVVVVVSCRSFDAEHDMRLRSLIRVAKPITLAELPWESVQELLCAQGFQPAKWPPSVKELLSRPQHLKMFLRHFPSDSGQPAFTSLQAMLERILEERVLHAFGLSAANALDAMASEMSVSEDLWVPLAPFQKRFSVEVRQLQQADLVRTDQGGFRVGFVHQTLFEFLRGRSFAGGDTRLYEEITAKQDGLAIRPVLWSAISYLRNGNLAVYRKEIKALLEGSQVRLHIKLLLVDFLGEVGSPLIEEAECLRIVLRDKQIRPHVMRAIEKKPDWFALLRDAVARCGEEGPDAAWQASWVLGPALAFDRAFVLSTLESSWLSKPEVDQGTFNVFRECTEWDDRAARIIERIAARTAIAPMSLCNRAGSMAKTRPDLGARLVRVGLDRDLARARSETDNVRAPGGPHDPTERETEHYLREAGADASAEEEIKQYLQEKERMRPLTALLRAHGDWHGLDVLAKLGPADLIEALWTWVEEAALMLSTPASPGFLRYKVDHGLRFGEGPHSCSYLAQAIWTAASAFAEADSSRFLKWVTAASKSEAVAVHRLIVHGLIQIADRYPAAVVEYLSGDHRRLQVGNDVAGNRGTRDLLEAARKSLSKQQAADLVAWIESWIPYELEAIREDRRASYAELSAQNRLDLLSALTAQKLGAGIRPRITPWEGGCVEPTKKAEELEKMSDVEVLSFLAEWPDNRQANADYRFGGSYDAATQFGEFAKRQRARAMSIIPKLRPAEQELAAGAGIDALAAEDCRDPEAVCGLLRSLLMTFRSETFRERAAWALVRLSQHGEGLREESILDLSGLLTEPRPPSPPPEAPFFPASKGKPRQEESVLWDLRGGALPNGNYPVLLALTLGLLRRNPSDRGAWLEILESHIEKAERPEVWQAMLDQLRYLGGCERVRSSDFVNRLFQKYPSLVTTVDGVRFLASNHSWLPAPFFHQSIARLEASNWPSAQRAAGELWMLRVGLVPDDGIAQQRLATALRDLEAGGSSEFLLGFVTSAAQTWTTSRFRETSNRILLAAAQRAHGSIAEAVVSAFDPHEDEQLPGDACTDQLLSAIAAGSALLSTQHTSSIADRLKELLQKGYSARAVGQICRRMVEVAGTAIADIGNRLYLAGDDLIDIAVTLQKFPEARADATWVFEQLLAMNAYKVTETVAALDQRVG